METIASSSTTRTRRPVSNAPPLIFLPNPKQCYSCQVTWIKVDQRAARKHGRRRKGSGRGSLCLVDRLRRQEHGRSSQLVIGCRRIQQGLSQYWRSNSRCQFTEAARFRAVLCGRVGQSGGVPIGHHSLQETQGTEHDDGNSAEAKCVEQGFHGSTLPGP